MIGRSGGAPARHQSLRLHLALASAAVAAVMQPALASAQATFAPPPKVISVQEPLQADRVAQHAEMARRMYEPQMTPRWPLGQLGSALTADGKPRAPWTITTWGPLSRESHFVTSAAAPTEHTGEFQMYWSRMPDFRITKYTVWPTEQGWIARIIYEGTNKEGKAALAHQVDIVSVDDTGKVTRIEWHCDAGEWIDQVWSKASGMPAAKVREVLAQPNGWNHLIDISLGRAKP
jgi:hypothetical protein